MKRLKLKETSEKRKLQFSGADETLNRSNLSEIASPQFQSTTVGHGSSQASNKSTDSQSSEKYLNALKRWFEKSSELALDFRYDTESDEIIELNDMNDEHPSAAPLKLRYDPDYERKVYKTTTLLEDSRQRDKHGYPTVIHDKYIFRDRLRKYPEKYLLTSLNDQQIKIITKHYKPPELPGFGTNYQYMSIVQTEYCEDDKIDGDENPNKEFQPITGT